MELPTPAILPPRQLTTGRLTMLFRYKRKHAILSLLKFLLIAGVADGQNDGQATSLHDYLLREFVKAGRRADGSKIVSFQSHTILYEGFDAEILKKLKELHPNELKAALSSSGNMHNPKVLPLRKPFDEALLKTETVLRLDNSLRKQGYAITDASHEKLVIDKSGKTIRFKVIAGLICSPINTEQGGADQSATVPEPKPHPQ